MFAFGLITDDEFSFVQSNGIVYTYSSKTEAQTYFKGVRHHAHLYEVETDLSVAWLLEAGDGPQTPTKVELTNAHKLALWTSYRYKSLLDWNPLPEEVRG